MEELLEAADIAVVDVQHTKLFEFRFNLLLPHKFEVPNLPPVLGFPYPLSLLE